MSFRDELQDIQNNINKPVPVDEKEYQRKLNQVYDEIKERIRSQVKQRAVKEKTDVYCGWVNANYLYKGCFYYFQLCEETRKKDLFNIYVKISLTGLGKRVFSDLEEKARQDEISLSIFPVRNMLPGEKVRGTWGDPDLEIWEYDIFHKWISKSRFYDLIKQSDIEPRNRKAPLPFSFCARYEVHL